MLHASQKLKAGYVRFSTHWRIEMNQILDPRTSGYSYGAGWGLEPKPAVYFAAMKIARVLQRRATELGQESWALDMAIRNVRLATLGREKIAAVAALEVALAKYLPH
jgi:hypothetical protein